MSEQGQPRARPRRVRRWLLAIAVVAVGLELIGQLVVFVRGPRPAGDLERLYRPHPYRVYMLVPGARSARGDISVNSQGFRGPEIEPVKPAGVVRIACLGESSTFNDTATTDGHTYPAHLERFLNEHYAGRSNARIEVINAGLPGYTSLESLIYFQSRLLDYELDVAIFHHAVNDTVFLANFPDFASDYTHARTVFRMPKRHIWERLALAKLLSPGGPRDEAYPNRAIAEQLARRTLVDPDRLHLDEAQQRRCFRPERLDIFERNVRNFIYTARGHGVAPVLATVAYDPKAGFFGDVVGQINTRVRQIAQGFSVPLVDFAREMPWDAEAFVDRCHLRDGPKGLERKGQLFADSLIREKVIEKRLGDVRMRDGQR